MRPWYGHWHTGSKTWLKKKTRSDRLRYGHWCSLNPYSHWRVKNLNMFMVNVRWQSTEWIRLETSLFSHPCPIINCFKISYTAYEVCKLNSETDLKQKIIWIILQIIINIIFLKVTSFSSHTMLETVFPIFISVLEVRFRNSLQLISYSLLNVFDCAKMTLRQFFNFRKRKNSQRLKSCE